MSHITGIGTYSLHHTAPCPPDATFGRADGMRLQLRSLHMCKNHARWLRDAPGAPSPRNDFMRRFAKLLGLLIAVEVLANVGTGR